MRYKDFGDINEEKILEKYPEVLNNVEDNFKAYKQEENQDDSLSKGYTRVLKMNHNDINPHYIPREKSISNNESINMGGYQIDSNIRNNNGASYVVIVAAIIALIAIVYIVTTTILGMLDGLV